MEKMIVSMPRLLPTMIPKMIVSIPSLESSSVVDAKILIIASKTLIERFTNLESSQPTPDSAFA